MRVSIFNNWGGNHDYPFVLVDGMIDQTRIPGMAIMYMPPSKKIHRQYMLIGKDYESP
jgi:hypothetical protein